MKPGRRLLRIASYLSLAVLSAAGLALLALWLSGGCLVIRGYGLRCRTDSAEMVRDAAVNVLTVAVITGIPTLLAAIGIAYLAKDIWRWREGRTAKPATLRQGPRPPLWRRRRH